MNIRPRLEVAEMDIAMMNAMGVKSYVRTNVELWKEVGLCVHRFDDEEYHEWRVSHYDSGRLIVKRIWDRKEAIRTMMQLRTILLDWRAPYEQMMQMAGQRPIMERVVALQYLIDTKGSV